MIYEAAEDELSVHKLALVELCKRVTRVGHSSSLVWMRMELDDDAEATHVPDEFALATSARIVSAGAMNRLESAYNGRAIDKYARIQTEIASIKGVAKKKLEALRTSEFPNGAPTTQRPSFSLSRPYREIQPEANSTARSSVFDQNFIVLCTDDASTQVFGIESIGAFTKALIGLLLGQIESTGRTIRHGSVVTSRMVILCVHRCTSP